MRTVKSREAAGFHRAKDGALNQRLVAGTARDEHGVIPGVTDLFLGGAGGALDDFGGIACDRGGEMLGEPRFRRAGLANQEQCAIGHQRGNGDLHQPLEADVLWGDFHIAHHTNDHDWRNL